MALTPEEKSKLIKILGRNAIEIDQQLAAYSDDISSAMLTDVSEEIVRWSNGTMKGSVWFDGNEANEGFNMSATNTADNSDPKTNIERLLFFETAGSAYQIEMVRG